MLRLQHVGAFRDSIINCFLSIKDEYSKIIYNKIDEDKTCLVDNIYFGYIPSEFKFSVVEEHDYGKIIIFKETNPENKGTYIEFEEQISTWDFLINSESGELTEYTINDKDVIYSENDSIKILFWQENGALYTLSTNTTKENILEMVKNIEVRKD